ncbi:MULTISPECIES: hypothetical protein [Francisella]|uniref:IS30 family transposase n=1 Tax=Francisella opportunistica TaxID=2016517 RepID=A0A345JTL9_9GAMM|nr:MULTISPECIES: hypothetical protein [Francisella]APC92464.1 hypothetical protein BBG19_1742 [Francisella sp. MA067296]AXH30665.1 hypothetical protein CGC43_08820 [Francisella opportunistica]AXH32307.1 hypothetical protein CGC44_08795 [Francisella opportunistica]AXH33955.1 hypothetical protein CGC45_08860 [Francisella opportunistica]
MLEEGYAVAEVAKLRSKCAQSVLEAMLDEFSNLPTKLYISIIYDSGKEFASHQGIEKGTAMTF